MVESFLLFTPITMVLWHKEFLGTTASYLLYNTHRNDSPILVPNNIKMLLNFLISSISFLAYYSRQLVALELGYVCFKQQPLKWPLWVSLHKL